MVYNIEAALTVKLFVAVPEQYVEIAGNEAVTVPVPAATGVTSPVEVLTVIQPAGVAEVTAYVGVAFPVLPETDVTVA